MPTLAAGSLKAPDLPKQPRDGQIAGSPGHSWRAACVHSSQGFTLLELLVVLLIIAVASAGVALTLRDTGASDLERDAQRLAAVLESGRAKSRMQGTPVVWRGVPGGFVLEGLDPPLPPQIWLNADTTVNAVLHHPSPGAPTNSASQLSLGPEPILEAQAVVLAARSKPALRVQVATDGLRPFAMVGVGTALGQTAP
jgi:general secretion pathway protein H